MKATGLLSNQGEESVDLYFIMVPLRKSIKVWYSKALATRDLLQMLKVGGGGCGSERCET